MIRRVRAILACERAASAAEFALVLPILGLLLLGTIDAGRLMWEMNKAEKATQMGVRYAIVSDPVATIVDNDFVGSDNIPGGDKVSVAVFDNAVCTSAACDVTGTTKATGDIDTDAFDAIVAWMQKFDPTIAAEDVTVTYRNVGLGYAGNPTGPDVSPLTTIEVGNRTFTPMILFGAATLNLPPAKASLTLEDGDCSSTDECGASN